jgi:hypothetical protein
VLDKEIEEIYIDLIVNLYQIAKKLIKFVEYVSNYTPESHEFSQKFLAEIDKDLEANTPRWRDRIQKLSTKDTK